MEMGGGGSNNLYLSYRSLVPGSILHDVEADLRVLGIGSGSGEADSIFLKKLLQSHSRVYSRVVEPCGERIEQFKALVREDPSFGGVKFDWCHQTAEEYFQNGESTKFHLLHAVHVLYFVEDLHATLRDMWEQLVEGGHMLIILEADKGTVWELREHFWKCFGHGDRLKTPIRTSGDVRQWLDAMGIRYVTSGVLPKSLR
ncbi:histamine N-methyltransferase-like [Branchiostoma floridae]|uniref:Histamine N-methyltransferase-like n=1 Tax=Branchiostoma floridae TaxID=7739 RepID=A0A9J7MSD1_BRAFL|nr:histamine N-methyltransferase-like [Branchiostoma floridae]